MLPDVEALATEVAATLNAALMPVLERLAAAEARLNVLGDLRDRVVTVEAKSAAAPAVVDLPPDLTPLLERLARIEAQLDVLGDVRDRVITVEAKAAPAPPVQAVDVTPILERLSALDVKADTSLMAATVAQVVENMTAIRERLSVVETRAPVAGPAGNDGADGQQGKDGADGLGFDDLIAEHDGERTITLKVAKGERVKDLGAFVFPVEIYRGVYLDGKCYERGDGVTFGGSEWHCNEDTTTKPGEGSKAWTLKVKRGRDGKDGRDAVSTPVVSVGRPS